MIIKKILVCISACICATTLPMDKLILDYTGLINSLKKLEQSISNLLQPVPAQNIQLQVMPPSYSQPSLGKGALINNFKTLVRTNRQENNKLPSKSPDIIRIMTYNVHAWANPEKSPRTNAQEDFTQITNVIRTINPDVLILQEVVVKEQQPGKKANFASSQTYQWLQGQGFSSISACDTFPRSSRWFGNVIASKIPFTSRDRKPFITQESPLEESRCYSVSTLMINNQSVQIIGTHLEVGKIPGRYHELTRFNQAKELIEYAQNTQNVIIAGDFNATTDSSTIKHVIRNGFKNSFSSINWNMPNVTTWSGNAIDFIFISPRWNFARLPIQGAYIYYSKKSDHLPIILDIKKI